MGWRGGDGLEGGGGGRGRPPSKSTPAAAACSLTNLSYASGLSSARLSRYFQRRSAWPRMLAIASGLALRALPAASAAAATGGWDAEAPDEEPPSPPPPSLMIFRSSSILLLGFESCVAKDVSDSLGRRVRRRCVLALNRHPDHEELHRASHHEARGHELGVELPVVDAEFGNAS